MAINQLSVGSIADLIDDCLTKRTVRIRAEPQYKPNLQPGLPLLSHIIKNYWNGKTLKQGNIYLKDDGEFSVNQREVLSS